MSGLGQDLKLALRVFWKNPAFAGIVVLTLALGSGANTAIFTLLDQVMLRVLPVERPDRLVVLSRPRSLLGLVQQPERYGDAGLAADVRGPPRPHAGLLGRPRALLDAHPPLGERADRQRQRRHGLGRRSSRSSACGRLSAVSSRADDDRTPVGPPRRRAGARLLRAPLRRRPGVVGQDGLVNSHPMTVIGVAPPGFDGVEVGRRDRRVRAPGDAAGGAADLGQAASATGARAGSRAWPA